jgi:hypothetical protein
MTSQEKVYLNRTTRPDPSPKHDNRTFIKVHGCLMVIAWMFFADIGTFTAGFFRKRFPENSGIYWFHIHQISMSITWILSMLSALVMFIGVGFGPLELDKIRKNPHAVIGIFTLILTFVQPIMGYLRPDPYSNKRRMFKWIHKSVGYLTTILSLIAIYLASILHEAMLIDYAYIVSGSFVVFAFAGQVFLRLVKQRGLTDGVTFGYVLGIIGIFTFMLAFLIVIIIS